MSPVKRSHYSATSYSNNENGNGGVNGAGNGDESYGTRLSQMARDPQYVWNRIMLVFIILLLCQVSNSIIRIKKVGIERINYKEQPGKFK